VTTSFAEYLRLYEASWSKLQSTSPRLNSYEDRSLYTTWKVTFDRIQKESAASAQLLKLWAYFDKQDLWFGLLRHAHTTNDEWMEKLIDDEMDFNKAVRLLCEYGLAHPEASPSHLSTSAGYSMHSCVHSWTISVLNDGWDDKLSTIALTCVASAVPSTNTDKWWFLQRRLLPHAARHEQSFISGRVDITQIEWALHNLGNLYLDQGKLAEAEKMYKRALQGYEEALGANHTSTLNTVNNLGLLYRNQGKLAEAEKMHERALQGKEEALGASHTSTLDTVNNLGLLYADQGKLAEAEKIYERALQGYEES
jgi:tetratricopeptide (TPR) repeat protein